MRIAAWRRSPGLLLLALLLPACNRSHAPGIVLALSTHSLSFTASASGSSPAPKGVLIQELQGATNLAWSVSSDQPWLRVAPASGVASGGGNLLTASVLLWQAEGRGSETNLTNAPNGQEDGSAIWTGTELVFSYNSRPARRCFAG
jgi:hypothetical protein